MLDSQPTISQLINRDPEIMGGTPVFMGTRVPIKTLFDHLEGGYTLEGFLEQFPTVHREQAIGVLQLCRELLLAVDKDIRASLARLDQLAAEISAHGPAGVSAQDAVNDVRRDF